MGQLHIRQQGIQSNRNKTPDTDPEDKWKTNVVFYTTVDPGTSKEGEFYSNLCGRFPITSNKRNKYIYVMYVYDCNVILTTLTKNRSDKDMIRYFTELATDFKNCGINPRSHFMDNEEQLQPWTSITSCLPKVITGQAMYREQ